VGIIGGGSSGMAAAWSLSRFHEKYDVVVIEASRVAGGVACTFEYEYAPGKKVPVNYGVQGGSPKAHQNTIELMKACGFDIGYTSLEVSFGKGAFNWKNYESSPLQEKLRSETRFFGKILRWIARFELLTIFVSIDFVLSLFRFSEDFRQRMVYPLVALFFGTGNQTPKVSAAVVARVFLDDSLAIFDYDPDYLLNQTPTNVSFDDLQTFYEKMRESMTNEHCQFHMGRRVTSLQRKDGKVFVQTEPSPAAWRGGSDQLGGEYPISGGGARCQPGHAKAEIDEAALRASEDRGSAAEQLEFDELIFACPANVARELLGTEASFLERSILSSVEYFHDLTITHTDREYMAKHNEVDDRAIYFIKTYDERPSCLEMGFELTAYQPALKCLKESGDKIYQTIYLDKAQSNLWTIADLNPSKVLDRAWWSAFSHTYAHFRRVVPWVWTLQGHKHTWYSGSWTLFNTHDIAICSGFAAAERLGAPYPFHHNLTATATYDTVLNASHLRWRSKR
jgi:predicted NAD/FAD-binding protein